MDVKLEWDTAALAKVDPARVSRVMTKGLTWGGRDALRGLASGAQRVVRDRKALAVKRVKGALKTTHPRTGASLPQMVWVLRASGAPVAMSDYPHKDTQRTSRKGVWVTVNKGVRKQLRHAFEVRLRSGHVGIFERSGAGGARLPIKELFTSRVSEPVGDAAPELLQKAQETFTRTWARVLKAELAK